MAVTTFVTGGRHGGVILSTNGFNDRESDQAR